MQVSEHGMLSIYSRWLNRTDKVIRHLCITEEQTLPFSCTTLRTLLHLMTSEAGWKVSGRLSVAHG